MKKVLLIFGANGQLAKRITEFLLTKGFDRTYLFDFNFDKSYSTAEQIIVSDLSSEANVEKAFESIKTDKDSALYLFSTIGGFEIGETIWNTSLDNLHRMLNTNFITNFNIAKKFSELTIKSKYGVCGFTSAATANHPSENTFAYGVSKAALSYMIKNLSIEGEKINLSVFGIAPFIIDTDLNRKWNPDADFSKWAKPLEIASIVYNLFENYKNVSGNILDLKIRITG